MKKFIIYIYFIGLALLGNSQQLNGQVVRNILDTLEQRKTVKINQTDKFMIIGTALNFSNVQDSKMSNMIYSGPGMGSEFITYRTFKKYTYFTGFNFQYTALFGPKLDSYVNGMDICFNKVILHELNSENWKMGASTNLEAHGRIFSKIGNDAINGELLATINFASSYSFDFNFLNRKNTFDIRAELPLFAYALRFPKYNCSGINNLFMPIGKYKALRTKFTIISPFKYSNENRFSISYEWDFYTFKENQNLDKLVSGTHFITFCYWLKKM